MEKLYTVAQLKKREVIAGVVLFIISLSFFGLRDFSKSRPLRISAATTKSCASTQPPIGATSTQLAPIWCYENLNSATHSATSQGNSFLDNFKNGNGISSCCGGYSIFHPSNSTDRIGYWQQETKWYVDSQAESTLMMPNDSFLFEAGKFVVQAALSPSMPGYNENISYDFIITSASSPTINTGSHSADRFKGAWTLICSITGSSRRITCSLIDKKNVKLFEKNIDQPPGQLATIWKQCSANQPSSTCQNTFRFEFTKTSITVMLNNTKYGTLTNLPPLPDEVLTNKLYVYFGSINNNDSNNTFRFNWSTLSINPNVLSPTPTTKVSITPTPTSVPTSSLQLKGNGFARVSHASYYNVPEGWTIESWFKDESPKGYNHETQYILTKGDSFTRPNVPFILGIEYENIFVGTRFEGNNKVLTYNLVQNNIAANQWQHVAASYNKKTGEMILYINGIAVLKTFIHEYSTKDNTDPLYMGKNGNKAFWIGKLDDIRIWETPRTSAQIRDSYQKQFTSSQKHLIGNWRFDETKGNVATDSSSKKENASVINGIWSPDVHPAL